MTTLDHSAIQEEAFKVLVFIAELCDKEGLKYVLIYGTLLGAARHGGFIPWDDDVDIAMPRPDYERLRALLAEGSDGVRFFDHTTTDDYPYLIGRVSLDTTRIHRDDELDCGMGVFVDVYPIDNLGNDYRLAVAKAKVLGLLSSLYFASTRTKLEPYCRGSWVRRAYVSVARAIGSRRIRRLLRLFTRESWDGLKKTYVGPAVWMTFQSRRNVLFLRYFTEFTEIEFNGRFFKAPRDFDEMLNAYYGDYMSLPPTEQQKPHHEYEAFYV